MVWEDRHLPQGQTRMGIVPVEKGELSCGQSRREGLEWAAVSGLVGLDLQEDFWLQSGSHGSFWKGFKSKVCSGSFREMAF